MIARKNAQKSLKKTLRTKGCRSYAKQISLSVFLSDFWAFFSASHYEGLSVFFSDCWAFFRAILLGLNRWKKRSVPRKWSLEKTLKYSKKSEKSWKSRESYCLLDLSLVEKKHSARSRIESCWLTVLDLEFGIQSVNLHVFFVSRSVLILMNIIAMTQQKDPRAWAEYSRIVENHMDRIILNPETINRSPQKGSFHIACKTLKFVK